MPKGIRAQQTARHPTYPDRELVSIEMTMDKLEHMGIHYSLTHLRKMARDGVIPGYHYRHRWFFDADAVVQALAPKDAITLQDARKRREQQNSDRRTVNFI